uniref:Uncharacterized protein n=1 Tax=Meloidogyne hapla TaxID=6305 RepID=A0A1I8BTU5_MELHA
MLSNFDFNSDNLKESGKHLAEKYGQTIQSNKIPDYMKIMLLITGLAGKEKFKDSIGERIKFYLANNLVEELLSLLIVHKASDLIDIIEKLIKNNDFSEDYKWFKEMFEEKFKQIGIELVSNPPAGTSATGRTTLIDLMARSGRLKPGGILIEECESEDPQEGSTNNQSDSVDNNSNTLNEIENDEDAQPQSPNM